MAKTEKPEAEAPEADDMREMEYKAECDLRTLIDAEKIKADKTLFKAAMAKASTMKKALSALGGE